jgi:rhamnosyltransferase
VNETRHISIAAVTVAYNGRHVLGRHITALLGQTRRIDEIIVVNNGSNDQTAEFLRSSFPAVKVIEIPTNTGVGGGFSAGPEYAAAAQKHDWVWLFDQDSVPRENCLEMLLNGLKHLTGNSDEVAILAPAWSNPGAKGGSSGLLWRNGWVCARADGASPVSFVDSVISSGTLIRREALERVGLPRADFFMDFVDHEHCLRLRRHDYKIVVVRDSILDHTLGDPRQVRILGFSKTWNGHVPWREYYMTRNEIFTIWQYYPDWKCKISAVRRLFRHAIGVILFGNKKIKCLRMMCLGFTDGLSGRLGIRFQNSPS